VAETARYLYAVCRDVPPGALEHQRGLGDQPLDVVTHRDLAAVVSTVELDEYGEDALRANLERMDWLERVARQHDAVVHALAEVAPTAPMRLATILMGDHGVVRRLSESHDALAAALERVAGRGEWSVKVIVEAPVAAAVPEARAPSGAEYLRRKKAQAETRTADAEEGVAVASRIHQRLAEFSVASRQLPPQDPRLTGLTGAMVLNAAYLVPTDDRGRFVDEVSEVGRRHPELRVDCQGPWPAYSFATLDEP
jgi:hypothetical protein